MVLATTYSSGDEHFVRFVTITSLPFFVPLTEGGGKYRYSTWVLE